MADDKDKHKKPTVATMTTDNAATTAATDNDFNVEMEGMDLSNNDEYVALSPAEDDADNDVGNESMRGTNVRGPMVHYQTARATSLSAEWPELHNFESARAGRNEASAVAQTTRLSPRKTTHDRIPTRGSRRLIVAQICR